MIKFNLHFVIAFTNVRPFKILYLLLDFNIFTNFNDLIKKI